MKFSTLFYRLHSPKCFKCGKPICPEPGEKEALRIIAMDKSFHKACFVCEVNFVYYTHSNLNFNSRDHTPSSRDHCAKCTVQIEKSKCHIPNYFFRNAISV